MLNSISRNALLLDRTNSQKGGGIGKNRRSVSAYAPLGAGQIFCKPFDLKTSIHKERLTNKVTDIVTAVKQVKSGDTLMLGGFCHSGSPYNLLYELEKHPEINNLTLVSEDMGYGLAGFPQGQEVLVFNKQVKELIISFLGKNKRINEAIESKELKLTLVPQGTLIERIRAGGAGIGGFYTPTGVGTVVEEGKETKTIDGRKYLLEYPLRANVAFIKAHKADRMGNAIFRYSTSKFNIAMATAADIVVLEAEELMECGEIEPEQVGLPGVCVDYIVPAEKVVF